MSNITTVQVDKSVVESLKELKSYPRQTYTEIILQMIKVYAEVKKKDQYDKFLHNIQQCKMKELWDNKEDEAWESV